jgi:3D (Asp-Asp-Asp) domain-containing protein
MTLQINGPSTFIKWSAGLAVLMWIAAAGTAFYTNTVVKIENQAIPFDVKVKKSWFVQKGWTIWLQEGQDGYAHVVNSAVYVGDKKIDSKNIYSTGIIKKPKPGFMIKGVSDKKNPVTAPKVTYAHFVHKVVATAYDPSPESNGLNWAGITALGWRTRYGIVAVDPRVISLRSLVFVEGYGLGWTGDTGGAIKGKHIDLCYNSTDEVYKWGKRKVNVYILGINPAASKKQFNKTRAKKTQ